MLLRIRQARIARGRSGDLKPDDPSHSEGGVRRAGLIPDPVISKLSEQLVAAGLLGAPDVPAQTHPDVAPIATPSQPMAVDRREDPRSRPDRISRQYEPAQLGISPLNERDTKLKLEMSFARSTPAQFGNQPDLAKLVGLEPLTPTPRRDGRDRDVQPAPSQSRMAPTALLPAIDTIPTLGPGMVWRLSEAGVRTMADLARSDAAALRSKLGQIGRLAKVEDWIAHARAVVSGERQVSRT